MFRYKSVFTIRRNVASWLRRSVTYPSRSFTRFIIPAGELREDIPLKTGTKSTRWCSCDEEFFGGSKFINISFAVLSFIITVALLVQIYYGDYQVTPHGSVATDSRECSAIGTSVLKNGGNAVDAVIASAFCLAVVNPHVTGLDASGQLLFYNHKTRINPITIEFNNLKPGIALLPRLITGLAYVHKKYSKLPWKELVQPATDLAKNGFLVSRPFASSFINYKGPKNVYGGLLEAGNKLILSTLGDYLSTVGNIPEEELYTATSSMQDKIESPAVVSQFRNYNVYAPSAPGIGSALLLNLQELDHLNFNASDSLKPWYVSTVAEVTQTTYKKLTATEKFYGGTSSNIAVMDLNDIYVSMVTGMSSPFGTGNMAVGGYMLDKNYYTKFASRIPLIITDSNFVCGRRIVLGVSDMVIGSQVVSSLLLDFGNATTSIEAPRFHILNNGAIGIEEGHTPSYPNEVINNLKQLVSRRVELMKEPYSSSNVVEKYGDVLNSHSDSRGGGIASRF